MDSNDIEKFEEEIKEIIRLYFDVKQLVLLIEHHDPEGKLPLPTINELRNAFDHFMRFLAPVYGIRKIEDIKSLEGSVEKYLSKQIDKIKSHLFRVGFDVFDLYFLNFKEFVEWFENQYTPEEITAIIPDYFSELKLQMKMVENSFAEIKSEKDSGYPTELITQKQFKEFQNRYQEIDRIWKEIQSKTDLIEDYRKKSKKWQRRRIIIQILIGIGCSIVGGAVAYFVFR